MSTVLASDGPLPENPAVRLGAAAPPRVSAHHSAFARSATSRGQKGLAERIGSNGTRATPARALTGPGMWVGRDTHRTGRTTWPYVRMNQKIVVGIVFVSAMFMNIMDITIVNVALPTIGRDFHIPPTAVDGVVIAYLVSLAVFIPASGWLGDRFGGKRVLLTAIVVFTIGSVLCGLAQNMTQLVAFRVLQGAGGGMMAPVGMAMLFRVFPPAERVRAASIMTVGTTLAPAIGPVLGGFLVTDFSWRWVFFVNLPIGIVAVLFGALFLERTDAMDAGRFDVPGFILGGAGLGLLMYGVSEGPLKSWSSTDVIVSCVTGALLLSVFVVVELRTTRPMVDLHLLKERLFRSTNVVMFLAAAAFLGTLYLIPLYFQDARGLTALQSGLSTFPEAFGVMIGAQFASRLIYPRIGPRRHVTGGLVGLVLCLLILTQITVSTNLWLIRARCSPSGSRWPRSWCPTRRPPSPGSRRSRWVARRPSSTPCARSGARPGWPSSRPC